MRVNAPKTHEIEVVDDLYNGIGTKLKAEFDEAAKAHIKILKGSCMWTWVFKTKEDAQPLEDLLTHWEAEYA